MLEIKHRGDFNRKLIFSLDPHEVKALDQFIKASKEGCAKELRSIEEEKIRYGGVPKNETSKRREKYLQEKHGFCAYFENEVSVIPAENGLPWKLIMRYSARETLMKYLLQYTNYIRSLEKADANQIEAQKVMSMINTKMRSYAEWYVEPLQLVSVASVKE